jgi:hypothetical protein
LDQSTEGTIDRFIAFYQSRSAVEATQRYGVLVVDPVVSATEFVLGSDVGASGVFTANRTGHSDSAKSFLSLALPSQADAGGASCTGIRIVAASDHSGKALQQWEKSGEAQPFLRVGPTGLVQGRVGFTLTDSTYANALVNINSNGIQLAAGEVIELGHATDTTLSRSAAGRLAVEGVNAVLTSSTDTLTNKDLTSGTNTFPTFNQSTTGNAATATKLATARTISGVSFDGSANVDVVTAKTVGQNYWQSGYISGNYYWANSNHNFATSAILGNGTVRVTPCVITDTITITRLFAEFTVAGEANSVYRIGIWNHDPATGKAGALVLDAGTISTGSGNAGNVATGGTPGVYEITVSQALSPGTYWIGGAVQGAATTQPTMRITAAAQHPNTPLGTALPGAGQTSPGFALGSQTGAFGSLASCSISSLAGARIGFKVQ